MLTKFNMKSKNMTSKNLLVFLVTALALLVSVTAVSAFGDITEVEVNNIDALGTTIDFANFAGQRIPVTVVFKADNGVDPNVNNERVAEDARVTVWISGERRDAVESDRFDVFEGRTYTRTVFIDMPFDLDDELEESRKLQVVVESEKDGTADEEKIDFTVQRESYFIEILSVDMNKNANAGESLAVDVVVKNRGSQFAEDTFVRVNIPTLGVEDRVYFGDLAPTDRSDPDKEDAVERRVYLKIPQNAKPGLHTVEIEAFNKDSITRTEKRVLVGEGSKEDTIVVAPVTSKQLGAGETGTYSMTIVNKGNNVRIYDLGVESPNRLKVDLEETIVVVPAGTSRTVNFKAMSTTEGSYTFVVNVNSDGQLVNSKVFSANVDGVGVKTSDNGAGNATVLLTVILAIVFIVLLVVLIVLLTRKPTEKSEEFGESYY
jgi:preprotein translocase subunit SecG